MADESSRPETGTMAFGEDWPGVFIRGDNAFGYAMALGVLLDTQRDKSRVEVLVSEIQVKSLLELLQSCQVGPQATPDIQRMRNFVDAKLVPDARSAIVDELLTRPRVTIEANGHVFVESRSHMRDATSYACTRCGQRVLTYWRKRMTPQAQIEAAVSRPTSIACPGERPK